MAGQEPCLLNGESCQSLPEGTELEDAPNEQSNQKFGEELLREALVDASDFESGQISYSVATEEPQVCDTGQEEESGEMKVEPEDSGLVHDSESILQSTTETIFPAAGQNSLLTNGSSEVLTIGATDAYTIGSVPEGHIISIPNDMMSDSAIITDNGDDNLQRSMEIADDSADQLLPREDTTQQLDLTEHMEGEQSSEITILQSSTETDHQLIQTANFPQAHHAITLSAPSGMSMTPEVLQSVLQQVQAQQLAQQQQQLSQSTTPQHITIKEEPLSSSVTEPAPDSQADSSSNLVNSTPETEPTATVSSVTSPPPLGSSQNPIRIIQQGNRYTPMQQLSTEQLQQIMQVVQQQHVNKSAQENGGSSAIIFNPQTNTRIMYRVIYPSELHKTQGQGDQTTYQVVRPITTSQEQQTGAQHQKRPYRRKKDLSAVVSTSQGMTGEQEEKDKAGATGDELSKEEKEERKKHRPRTRSGRVSKPPKHMVQDYKHIHVLDWDEDYDDSDGGYSDFKHSDEEGKMKLEGEEEQQSPSPDLFAGLGSVRPKNHKCQTCEKSYIGQAGLARHYRLNPDHGRINVSEDGGSVSSMHNGSIDGEDSKSQLLAQQDNSNLSRLSDSMLDETTPLSTTSAIPGGQHSGSTNLETFSEDSNTQDSLNSTGAPSPYTVTPSSTGFRGVAGRGRGRGRFRGRWAHLKYNAQMRRKNKLKEFIKQCSDEELMEIVLPRLASSISLWEFLMMKSEEGGTKPQVDVIYQEFESLAQRVRQACATHLLPVSETTQDADLHAKMVKVADKRVGVCLDLDLATYKVKEVPAGECSIFSPSLYSSFSVAAAAPTTITSTEPGSQLDNTSTATVAADMAGQLNSNASNSSNTIVLSNKVQATNGVRKRPFDSMDVDEEEVGNVSSSAAPKRQRISTLTLPPSNFSAAISSSGVFSVKTQALPAGAGGELVKENGKPFDTVFYPLAGPTSSESSPPLSNHSQARSGSTSHNTSQSPAVTSVVPPLLPSSSATLLSISSTTSSVVSSQSSFTISTSTSASPLQSPFVNISFPASNTLQKPGSVAHLLTATSPPKSANKLPQLASGHSLLINNNNKSSNSLTAQVQVLSPSGHVKSATGSSQVRSILSPLLGQLGVRASSGQRFVLAGPSSSPGALLAFPPQHSTGPGTTALLLAAGAAAGTHQVVRPPAPAQRIVGTNRQPRQQQTGSKPAFRSLLANNNGSKAGNSTGAPTIISKPTEVKVSRQLFHDATVGSSTASSLLRGSSSKAVSLLTNGKTNLMARTSSHGANSLTPPSASSSTNNKTLETPPSGQQFVASPNKVVSLTNGNGVGGLVAAPSTLSDMDIMGLEFATPTEDLAPSVVTSTTNNGLNGSVAPTSINECGSSLLKLNGNMDSHDLLSSAGKTLYESHSQNSTFLGPALLTNRLFLNHNNPLLEGSNQKLLPSLPLKSSPAHASKDTLNSINGSDLDSQSVSASLTNLNFPNSAEGLQSDEACGPLSNGDIPPISEAATDIGGQLNSAMDNSLPANNHLPEAEASDHGALSSVAASETNGTSSQQLLSEGTNIYQTEDGNYFIQSANGNTYQLQGAQGLPLETVQALLAGAEIKQ